MLPTEQKLTLQLSLRSPLPGFRIVSLCFQPWGHTRAPKVTSVEVELERGHLTTVLCTDGTWKKLYFAFFINSELSLACAFPQVKRTSGVQGTETETVLTSIFFERTISFFPPSFLDRLSWQHTATMSGGKKNWFGDQEL